MSPRTQVFQPQNPVKPLVPNKTQSISNRVPIRLEKSLASLGFFTPSSRRLKNIKSKTIKFTQTIDGTRVDVSATIVPSALFGLPITADQDKYIALQKLILDRKKENGGVLQNPVGFTSAELLRALNKHLDSGKNYKEVSDWLDAMKSTTIISEGAVYLAKEKRRGRDRFNVFDRAVTLGYEFSDGEVADKNYVWLSEWQLENINTNFLLPIDFETYKQLKTHIAKILVPLLQVWLFASRKDGFFEKKYDDLCDTLALHNYRYLSDINRQLRAALDELQHHRYLKSWRVVRRKKHKNFKVIFVHGERFRSESAQLPITNPTAQEDPQPTQQPDTPPATEQGSVPNPLVGKLGKWGFAPQDAADLLSQLPPTQPVAEQLEYLEQEITRQGIGESGIRSPAGFIRARLQQNAPVPEHFQSSEKRQAQQEDSEARKAAHAQLQRDYEKYSRALALQHIEQNNLQDEYDTQELAKIDNLRHYLGDRRPEEEIRKIAHESVLDQFANKLDHVKTFDAWRADQQQPAAAAG